MTGFQRCESDLRASPRRWLVTGAAGFIGSNLVERLLRLGQDVTGLDNFATGRRENVADLEGTAGRESRASFRFVEGDVRDPDTCRAACEGVEIVLHQAALGSVPRSLADPLASHTANVDGFLNMLLAARDAGVDRFVYAGSSSVYGDDPGLPKVEDRLGAPLSPYAATKRVNELYADVFARGYGLSCVGLRYFNVFGRRQDPEGPYAAVIPKWIGSLLAGETCEIYGDGETSRDFCYIDNVLQANLLAATVEAGAGSGHEVYNVACGERTTLNELYRIIRDGLAEHVPVLEGAEPAYRDFRPGDVRHSLADIGKIARELGYEPSHSVEEGLRAALPWYVETLSAAEASPRSA